MIKKLFLLMIGRVQPVDNVHDVLRNLSNEVDNLNDIADYHQARIKELRSDIATAEAEISESERESKRATIVATRLTTLIVQASSVSELETPSDANP